MTDFTTALPAKSRFAAWLRNWLHSARRRHPAAADLDTLSDHMRRDIGLERDPLDQMSIRTLHDAMRFSS
jgi:hypothetical protein